MAMQEQVLEVRGEDVDEAIEQGLRELGVDRSDVDVEVLDSGSSGFLGIGGREAVVKLTVKVDLTAGVGDGEQPPSVVADSRFVDEPIRGDGDRDVTLALEVDASEEGVDTQPELKEEEVAIEIIENLLNKLQIEASTSLLQTEPDDLTGEQRWVVDINGEDLSTLIGNRGETLNAFQHIARLMTGHALHQRPKFIIDVDGYRVRREKALARLAERMAEKVVSRGQPLTLEPMPPNERRVIHLTLRNDERVYTESFGEGRRRKVRIYPSE